MSNLLRLSDEQLATIEAAIPNNRPGVKPGRNREVISGIIRVLRIGCRWEDCPADYSPYTIYNRFKRWSKAGMIWAKILNNLVVYDATDIQCIDSTITKAQPLRRRRKRGAEEQAIGRSRRTTKIHAVVDSDGRTVAFELTGGSRHDIRPAAPANSKGMLLSLKRLGRIERVHAKLRWSYFRAKQPPLVASAGLSGGTCMVGRVVLS